MVREQARGFLDSLRQHALTTVYSFLLLSPSLPGPNWKELCSKHSLSFSPFCFFYWKQICEDLNVIQKDFPGIPTMGHLIQNPGEKIDDQVRYYLEIVQVKHLTFRIKL